MDDAVPHLTFLGATQTVTGSRYLLEHRGARVLVDCGLFQGYKVLRERNWAPFPVPPGSIDAVVVSHAHLDHTGYLPALVRDGFAGPVYATPGTIELAGLLLPDSAHLLEEEASFAARRRSSRHRPPRPLYTQEDAERALGSFREAGFDEEFEPAPGVRAVLRHAGHILGAAQVRVVAGGRRLHFTGDLGRDDDPLMRPPRALEETDVLVCESTYGDRAHPAVDPAGELESVIRRVVDRGGVVLIPSFAVGRAESLLLHLSRLLRERRIPRVPVYLNSPMAVDASAFYRRHPEELRVAGAELDELFAVATMVRSVEDSKALNEPTGPKIIVSASGMLTGGRILHHVDAFGPDPRNAIVLAGYQAGGTRGADLLAGERSLRIYGRDVPIRAEVVAVGSMSAHADQHQLLDWLRAVPTPPAVTYLTHGELGASDHLRARIKRELGWEARVPEPGQAVRV